MLGDWQHFRCLRPKPIPAMIFGTKELNFWALGPSGIARAIGVP